MLFTDSWALPFETNNKISPITPVVISPTQPMVISSENSKNISKEVVPETIKAVEQVVPKEKLEINSYLDAAKLLVEYMGNRIEDNPGFYEQSKPVFIALQPVKTSVPNNKALDLDMPWGWEKILADFCLQLEKDPDLGKMASKLNLDRGEIAKSLEVLKCIFVYGDVEKYFAETKRELAVLQKENELRALVMKRINDGEPLREELCEKKQQKEKEWLEVEELQKEQKKELLQEQQEIASQIKDCNSKQLRLDNWVKLLEHKLQLVYIPRDNCKCAEAARKGYYTLMGQEDGQLRTGPYSETYIKFAGKSFAIEKVLEMCGDYEEHPHKYDCLCYSFNIVYSYYVLAKQEEINIEKNVSLIGNIIGPKNTEENVKKQIASLKVDISTTEKEILKLNNDAKEILKTLSSLNDQVMCTNLEYTSCWLKLHELEEKMKYEELDLLRNSKPSGKDVLAQQELIEKKLSVLNNEFANPGHLEQCKRSFVEMLENMELGSWSPVDKRSMELALDKVVKLEMLRESEKLKSLIGRKKLQEPKIAIKSELSNNSLVWSEKEKEGNNSNVQQIKPLELKKN